MFQIVFNIVLQIRNTPLDLSKDFQLDGAVVTKEVPTYLPVVSKEVDT